MTCDKCKKQIMKCKQLIERHEILHTYYDPCPHKAKYHVEYNEGTRNKRVGSDLCGIHLRSLKAWVKRAKNRLDFDAKLVVTSNPK
jgi:hypothetical protein